MSNVIAFLAILTTSNFVELPAAWAQPTPPVASTSADAKKEVKTPPSVTALADKVWAITNAVSESHIKPVSRSKMLRAGMKDFFAAAKQDAPADLDTIASSAKSSGDLKTLIEAPYEKADTQTRVKLAEALLHGVDSAVPGGIRLMEMPDKKEMAVQEQVSANRYVGIGIVLKVNQKEQRPEIGSAMLHGAARNAGIKSGDVIDSVDGKDTKAKPLGEVVNWLRDAEGTKVTVKVHQPGGESRAYTMVRAKVPFEHVFGFQRVGEENFEFRVDPKAPIAYLRISSYSSSTLHELRQFERKLHAAGYRALVLDLRNTGGGHLQHATLLVGGLLDGALLWKIQGKNQDEAKEFHAERENLFRDWPMVVLTHGEEGTNGLVAAALQDNGRAKLVGDPVKFDGFVRSVVELPGDKGALVLPSGIVERPTASKGWPVKPDYAVSLTPEQAKAIAEWTQRQEYGDMPRDAKAKPPADPQLAKAIEILKEALEKLNVTKN